MIPIRTKNDSWLGVLASAGVFLAGAVALISYFNQKEHRKLQKKNAELENEIKQLELLKLRHDTDGLD
jgi:predicted RND superfamily exporter protein